MIDRLIHAAVVLFVLWLVAYLLHFPIPYIVEVVAVLIAAAYVLLGNRATFKRP
jgi:Na+/H+ antiporter NhaD/arsenite permease-like protein